MFRAIFRPSSGVKTEIFTAYGIVSYCCGRQGFGERQRGTMCIVWRKLLDSALCSWRWAKDWPKHAELILEINKLLLLHLVGFSILLYLNWWCTVKHKSSLVFCC